MRIKIILAATVGLMGLTGCVNNSGVAEFTRYQQSFDRGLIIGESVLDRLSVAERALGRAELAPLDPASFSFDPTRARYYVDTVEPPVTASLRASLALVADYNQTVAALASGESAEALATRLNLIGNGALMVGTRVSALAAGPGGQLAGLAAGLASPLNALTPLTKRAFAFRTQAAFRDEVVARKGDVQAVMRALIDATPEIFNVIALPVAQSHRSVLGNTPFTEDETRMLTALQRDLANLVILLEASSTALDAAVEAIANGRSTPSLAGFAAATDELNAVARAARSAF